MLCQSRDDDRIFSCAIFATAWFLVVDNLTDVADRVSKEPQMRREMAGELEVDWRSQARFLDDLMGKLLTLQNGGFTQIFDYVQPIENLLSSRFYARGEPTLQSLIRSGLKLFIGVCICKENSGQQFYSVSQVSNFDFFAKVIATCLKSDEEVALFHEIDSQGSEIPEFQGGYNGIVHQMLREFPLKSDSMAKILLALCGNHDCSFPIETARILSGLKTYTVSMQTNWENKIELDQSGTKGYLNEKIFLNDGEIMPAGTQ
jgi:hypothetical protein